MQSVEDCFLKTKNKCFKYISSQETKKQKFKNKERMIKSFLIPLCFWISKIKSSKRPTIIGLSGGQGTGKTTISSIMSIILKKYFKYKVCNVSIDDFYKTRKARKLLSKTKHPLLITRGVPGTHDVNLILKFLKKVKKKNFIKFKFPKFNKAKDERNKIKDWNSVKYKPEIVILEGWCIGARHQKYKQLTKSINSTERIFDKDLKWRKFVNLQLMKNYKKIFNQIDNYLYLKVSDFNLLQKWRVKQEKKLLIKNKNKKKLKIMKTRDLLIFMQTYQRITQQMFKDMPKSASAIVKLNKNHQINKIKFN